jgi:hypothetical protein
MWKQENLFCYDDEYEAIMEEQMRQLLIKNTVSQCDDEAEA